MGKVYFVGGGPGAPDLLTLRGARAVAAADIVIWGRSFLMEEAVTEHARPEAELLPWPPATMSDILAAYDRARDEGLTVARLHSGDPAIFGKLEEVPEAQARGLAWELVPGVSSVSAAAAALGRELTTPGGPRALILAARPRDAEACLGEGLPDLAAHGTTMALFMAASDPEALQADLLQGGYPPDAPCAVVHRASWPEQLVLECPLNELAARIRGHELDLLTLVVVGAAPDVEGAQTASR